MEAEILPESLNPFRQTPIILQQKTRNNIQVNKDSCASGKSDMRPFFSEVAAFSHGTFDEVVFGGVGVEFGGDAGRARVGFQGEVHAGGFGWGEGGFGVFFTQRA